jgi:hypothetical protein
VTQNATVAKDFASVTSSLGNGDINGAQTAFTALQNDMQAAQGGTVGSDFENIQNAVQSGDMNTAQSSLASFAKDLAMTATSSSNPLAPGGTLFQDIRSLQVAFQPGNTQNAQAAFTSAQSDLSAAAQNAPASSSSTPTQFLAEESVVEGLAGAPSSTDAASMQQATTMSILQSLQTSSSGYGGSTGFSVTPEMVATSF